MADSETHVAQHEAEQSVHHELKEESLGKELQQRKEDIIKTLKTKKAWIIYVVMLVIAWFGYYIRTLNVSLLQGKWLPDVDSYAFLRYAEYIVAHGKLMANDVLRYYPFGFDPRGEFGVLSYVIAYLYKIMHVFNPNTTPVDAAIFYPALSFVVAAIFFFLFVKKMLNYKVAIIATAILTVVPAFLYRTMAGVSDKEALAVALMFAGFYFYVSALKSEKPLKYLPLGIAAGIMTGILATVWGGYIFVMLSIGVHAVICNFLGLFKRRNFYVYSVWMLLLMFTAYIFYPARFSLTAFISSFTPQIMLLGFLMSIILILTEQKFFEKIKMKIENKIPIGLFALIFSLVLGFAILIPAKGMGIISGVIGELYNNIFRPFGESRWSLTVAENHLVYFVDWIAQFSWKYIAMFMAGFVFIFYNIIKSIKGLSRMLVWELTALSAIFIILLGMSRYSQASIFNGESTISNLAYIGSLIVFFAVLGYGYVKKVHTREIIDSVKQIDIMLILILIWAIIMTISARSAVRLLFIFAPVSSLLVSYFIVELFELARIKLKKDVYKIIALGVIVFIAGSMIYGFSQSVIEQAKYVGPSFNLQWQNSMNWVKENTPENAVFAHWWDYGYWVQWGANRATISDGGNAVGGVNHFVGRHILTAQSETEALEFMKSRNVTHLLIVSDEIGKYPAYSSIGADKNYDRYSWITTFTMQPNQISETRNETVYLFTGGTPLDDDFIYQGKLFPAESAGVAGVFLPIATMDVNTGNSTVKMQKVLQPEAVLVYGGQQVKVPLRCAYINGQEMIFEGKDSLEGCLRVLPTIEGNGQANPLGAALYLSPEVYRGLFAKIYLLNKEYPHIKLAYSDENTGMPLAIYQGRLIGPFKIWQITYPDNLNVPPEYYKQELPDLEVDKVRR